MKVSTTETIVVSQYSHATQPTWSYRYCNSTDNTYNRYSYLDEADMNS